MHRNLLNRISRRTALGATAAVVVTSVAMTTAPATAAGNSLSFAGGGDHVTVGANAAIFIDGTITFDDACSGGTQPGVNDFVYPATDVYIVPTGSATDDAGLTDAGGNGPNTIVALSSGAFIGEMIAATYPSGPLGDGVYDVVYDTCQDGVVGFEDAIWSEAITVDVPDGEIPPPSDSIRRLKAKARAEYDSWKIAQRILERLLKLNDPKAKIGCVTAPDPNCILDAIRAVTGVGNYSQEFEKQVLRLTLNRARGYLAIWQDPADPDFRQLPVITPEATLTVPTTGSPLADAVAALDRPLAEEGALTDALLHALERYQGAQAAGDADWALVQARAVADLSAALAEHLAGTTALQDLRATIAADNADLVARSNATADTINRVRSSGFTTDERRTLANLGHDDAAITALEATFVDAGRQVAFQPNEILAALDQLLASRTEMIGALVESQTGWAALADQLTARVGEPAPIADAGGPYTTGGQLTLDASASAAIAPATIVSLDWDLDGDGAFDDASGARPVVTIDRSRSIAVRVSDSAGQASVGVAVVNVTQQAIGAVTPSPASRALSVQVGATQPFSVAVPGGASVRWLLDGADVGNATSYSLHTAGTPDAQRVGPGTHVVSAMITLGQRVQAVSWIATVLDVDADGDGWTTTSDCDDTRADVEPGGFERLGNGRDDDCDPATIDVPVGGVTGTLMSWGEATGVGRTPPAGSNRPVVITSLGDQVRSIESTFGGGYVVMADGTVRAWGTGSFGELGNGTQSTSYAPVVVQNVGGGGALNGVIDVASDEDSAVALRADGSVVAWGGNANQQLGDGTTVAERLTPVNVLDAATGQPLTGVAQVEVGETTSFAVMEDGTVKVFGVDHCNGSGTVTTRHGTATTNPLFGDDVVQLASGDSGGAISLLRDGTVTVCSAYSPMLGRGPGIIGLTAALTPRPVVGLGAGSGVIDVAMGSSTATVLKDDGTVWTWGRNLNNTLGVLGVAPSGIQSVPAQVPLPAGAPVVDIESDYAATTFALRADGTVLVWGANVNGGGGTGVVTYDIAGSPQIDLLGNVALAVSNSMWNGLALVQPPAPTGSGAEPVRPLHWIDVSVSDGSIGEADGGTVTVSLSEAAPIDVTVGYDFDGRAAEVVVPAGAASVPVTLAVTDDAFDEADEELAVTVTAVSAGVRIADRIGLVTVLDDDAPPAVSIADAWVVEGATSLTDVALTVSLSAAADTDVVVDLATTTGTAEVGTDVRATQQSVVVPAGETSVITHVYAIGDSVLEDDEAFIVELSNPIGATLGDASATVTIADDEPIVVDVLAPSVVEGDTGVTPAAFRITATQPPTPVAITISWTLLPGTADADADVIVGSGQLTLTGGDVGVVEAAVVADETAEPLAVETFRLVLGEIVTDGRAVVVNDIALGRIADDDDATQPLVDAGSDVVTTEGTAAAIAGTVSGIDAPVVTWSVDQPTCSIADPAALATTVTCTDEVAATLTLTVDGHLSDSALLTVDNVAPSVTITSPVGGAAVVAGTPVTLAVTTADPGVADAVTCSATWGDTAVTGCAAPHTYSAAGSYTITVTATDGDGGTTTATTAVTVTSATPAMRFTGFFAPVDNAPVVNVVRAGATVPLKFSLGGDFGLAIFATGYPASTRVPCGCGRPDTLEETSNPGAATLTYNAATGRYQYNWKTSASWSGQCRILTLRLADGTEVTALFRFR